MVPYRVADIQYPGRDWQYLWGAFCSCSLGCLGLGCRSIGGSLGLDRRKGGLGGRDRDIGGRRGGATLTCPFIRVLVMSLISSNIFI